MALIVQKFGGSSLASLERVQHVANLVRHHREQGHQVVVVVSAMYGETDRLIDLAHAASTEPNEREFDALISTGEQVAASLLSMSLISNACPACSMSGSQVQIKTDNRHRRARILDIDIERLQTELSEGKVPVVTGFQGVSDNGHITTLGRGGSDITAVALAAALKADECQIFTDVSGVYTTDPRIVKTARLLSHITYAEMLELAGMGAKVLQTRSVEFAHKYNVPLRVLSSFEQSKGTLVSLSRPDAKESLVSGIAFDRNQARLSLTGIAADAEEISLLFDALSKADIEVDMIVQNISASKGNVDMSFTVHLDDFKESLSITKNLCKKLAVAEIIGDNGIAKVSVVGVGMKSHAGVASRMLQSLGEEGIAIQLITSSETKISVVIDEKYMELGVRTLHSAFELELQQG